MLIVMPVAQGAVYDDLSTTGINEGAIGTGRDDLSTPNINEGAIGSGSDDLSTPNINEGAINFNKEAHRLIPLNEEKSPFAPKNSSNH